MTVARTCTFDLPVPRRPGLADITNGPKEQRTPGPIPASFLSPEEYDQLSAQATAASNMIAVARVYVHYVAGAPVITAFKAPGIAVEITDFTPADTATGKATISWPASKFPTPDMPPKSAIVNGLGMIGTFALGTSAGVTSCRVETKDASAAYADIDFILEIF